MSGLVLLLLIIDGPGEVEGVPGLGGVGGVGVGGPRLAGPLERTDQALMNDGGEKYDKLN